MTRLPTGDIGGWINDPDERSHYLSPQKPGSGCHIPCRHMVRPWALIDCCPLSRTRAEVPLPFAAEGKEGVTRRQQRVSVEHPFSLTQLNEMEQAVPFALHSFFVDLLEQLRTPVCVSPLCELHRCPSTLPHQVS